MAEQQEKNRDVPVSGKGIAEVFAGCYDFERRTLYVGANKSAEVTLVFIDGLVSGESIAREIILPITSDERFSGKTSEAEMVDLFMAGAVYGYTAKRRDTLNEVVSDMLNGFCAVIFEKQRTAVTFETKSTEKRSVSQPTEEKVIKGAKDAFIEIMKVNTMLIRRKMRDPNLKIEKLTVGEKTNTDVAVVYINGFTNTKIKDEVIKRIKSINAEGMLTASSLEDNLSDQPKSPFPQMMTTERSDKFCINLLEGRVGILIDGLPVGYIVPATLSQFMKVPEDHANHFVVASFLTLLRYISIFLALLLPAFYVAVAMYHQEMLPAKLMESMIDAKKSVPFPTSVEVLTMLFSFELLQEAGLRLPSQIGETISIIGALIVGQSAVEAKIVSPVVVIIVAVAGIAGYTMPNQDFGAALRVCRILLVLMAIVSGMFGVAIGMGMLIYHLCTIESFGISYVSPFAGTKGRHISRALLRFSMSGKKDREPELHPESR